MLVQDLLLATGDEQLLLNLSDRSSDCDRDNATVTCHTSVEPFQSRLCHLCVLQRYHRSRFRQHDGQKWTVGSLTKVAVRVLLLLSYDCVTEPEVCRRPAAFKRTHLEKLAGSRSTSARVFPVFSSSEPPPQAPSYRQHVIRPYSGMFPL